MNEAFDAAILDGAVLEALSSALRPLARLAVRHQISLGRMEELLKLALIAEAELSLPAGERATDSHIHTITGMHRRDVARLRSGASNAAGDGARHSLARLVLQRWTGDANYIDARGRPLALATTEREGGAQSFEALVSGVSTNVGYRSLLDEWQRAGALSQEADGLWRLHLAQAAYVVPLDQRLRMTGLRLNDLGSALVHDLARDTSAHFHLFVDEPSLTPQSAQRLTELAHQVGRRAVASFNARASALALQDQNSSDATVRVTFGAFSHFADGPRAEAGGGSPNPAGAGLPQARSSRRRTVAP
jgi:Family of unknown function (DUF6502)